MEGRNNTAAGNDDSRTRVRLDETAVHLPITDDRMPVSAAHRNLSRRMAPAARTDGEDERSSDGPEAKHVCDPATSI